MPKLKMFELDSPNIEILPELTKLLEEFALSERGILVISISTIDGFHLASKSTGLMTVEVDKLAAITGSLCSLSKAAAEEILGKDFIINSVETVDGNVLVCRATYLGYSCVLTLAGNQRLTLGKARFGLRRLSSAISEIGKS